MSAQQTVTSRDSQTESPWQANGTSAHLNTFFDATYPEIESDFNREAALLVADSGKEVEILESAERAGLMVEEAATNDLQVPFKMAICFHKQAQFHPLKYITAITRAFIELGGIILNRTFVSDSIHQEGLNITTAGEHSIKSVHLVYATHIPPGITNLALYEKPLPDKSGRGNQTALIITSFMNRCNTI